MSLSTMTEAAADFDFVAAAANDNPAGFVTVLEDQPVEGGFDPVFGSYD